MVMVRNGQQLNAKNKKWLDAYLKEQEALKNYVRQLADLEGRSETLDNTSNLINNLINNPTDNPTNNPTNNLIDNPIDNPVNPTNNQSISHRTQCSRNSR